MRRVNKLAVTWLTMAALWCGCGSGAGDRLILQFVNFQDPANGQLDTIGQTSAQVDVVRDVCTDGSDEPFTETDAAAVFVNQGASDLVLQNIKVTIPNSGVPTYSINLGPAGPVISGGRCAGELGRSCGVDLDCVVNGMTSSCIHTESTIEFKLFDIEKKLLVTPGVYDVAITFSAQDASEENFNVTTRLRTTFTDFCHCSAGCQA